MNAEEHAAYFVLEADSSGNLRRTLHDPAQVVDRLEPGQPFLELLTREARAAGADFLAAAGNGQTVVGWTLELTGEQGVQEWRFAGLSRGGGTLIVGAENAEQLARGFAVLVADADRQLDKAQHELQQLAYAVSHDLQEPLRTVTGFAQLLEQRYANQFGEDADDYIRFVVEGALRMTRMIQGLLTFSRQGTAGSPAKPVDAEVVWQSVASNLAEQIEQSGARITKDALPRLHVNSEQLALVLYHLLENAIKFCGPQPPEVHVTASQEDDQWCFAVRDAGIGIAAKFHDRVFEIFHWLHPHTEYPGAGMGLAICKRIIEQHGGEIWVASEPGQGATFYFTLPVRPLT